MQAATFFRFDLTFIRLSKLFRFVFYPYLFTFLLKGILPTFEHEKVLKKIGKLETLIDCGSNKGQFAILSFSINNFKKYICFDPIVIPDHAINFFKNKNINVLFKKVALSNIEGNFNFYITERKDSSSLKKPKNIAANYFSDVYEIQQSLVNVKKLDSFEESIILSREPRLLKIDVQSNEFELLEGSKNVISLFNYIIIECTYFDLYENKDSTIEKIDAFLSKHNFKLIKEYNRLVRNKILISSDKLYLNKKN